MLEDKAKLQLLKLGDNDIGPEGTGVRLDEGVEGKEGWWWVWKI